MNYLAAILGADKPADISAIFNKLAQEGARTRRAMIDLIEETLMPQFEDNINYFQTSQSIASTVAEHLHGTLEEEDADALKEIIVRGPQWIEAIMLGIHKAKGDNSHPLVKEFLSQSLMMTSEEHEAPHAWLATLRGMKLPHY